MKNCSQIEKLFTNSKKIHELWKTFKNLKLLPDFKNCSRIEKNVRAFEKKCLKFRNVHELKKCLRKPKQSPQKWRKDKKNKINSVKHTKTKTERKNEKPVRNAKKKQKNRRKAEKPVNTKENKNRMEN